jgi:predicted nuclease with TOPRIM domain
VAEKKEPLPWIMIIQTLISVVTIVGAFLVGWMNLRDSVTILKVEQSNLTDRIKEMKAEIDRLQTELRRVEMEREQLRRDGR